MSNRPQQIGRREFVTTTTSALATSALTALGAGCTSNRSSRVEARKPNILFIFTAQQNIDTISAHGRWFDHPAHGVHWVRTPNLDRLAKRGVSFVESHAANPVCSPDRSCLLTGRMATETGVTTNNLGIAPDVPNVGQWFRENSDYRTYYCGKWHLPAGYPAPGSIEGFDVVPVGGTPCGDYNDFAVSAVTEAFLHQYGEERPFLYLAGFMNPHDICYWTPPLGGDVITAAEDHFGLGGDLPALPPNQDYGFHDPRDQRVKQWGDAHWQTYAYDYYRMIEKIDNDIGRVLDAVESRDDETIIVFTSDHGEGIGRHRRVQKWHPFEESVKVPLLISCPGRIEAERVDAEHLVSAIDIVPTLCEFAGIPAPPNTTGRSLSPFLTAGSPSEWRESLCVEFQRSGRILRTPQYKYVKFYRNSQETLKPFMDRHGDAAPFDPGRIDEYQAEETVFLFDMQKDPWETRNLALEARYSDLVAAHDRMLRDDWLRRMIPGQPLVPASYPG